jgi:hypothetical protein
MPRTHLPRNLVLPHIGCETVPVPGHPLLSPHLTHPYTGLLATLYHTLYRLLCLGPSAHQSLGSHVHIDRIGRIILTLRPRRP